MSMVYRVFIGRYAHLFVCKRIAVDERENRVTAHGHERCNAQRPIPRSHPLP